METATAYESNTGLDPRSEIDEFSPHSHSRVIGQALLGKDAALLADLIMG